ncbi:MAG TPA: Gfo/Idh/MocA family oxidoreductase [Gemmataceae bacterium]|nr:Gfo/Idh/MocA family oxidoreductase [Gemmataceae bacterium]
MSEQSNRRDFLKQTALAGVGFWAAGGVSLAVSKSANEQINFACIGVGGKGDSDSDQVTKFGNVVAICDIDDNTLGHKAEREVDGKRPFAKARKFNDFRKMFDEMGKDIDAVTVSTPDHTHAPASLMAMRLKKHVYCQKPLTHTVFEARLMRETAHKMGVATQMGNQGTAENGLRRAVELIRAGAIGKVHEVHVWTNRPIWPQGTDAILKVQAAHQVAMAALHGHKVSPQYPAVPKHVHWQEWLSVAAERPYDPIYHPFSWRGWWDFGTGAIGDMACHTANMAFMALKLDAPTVVLAESGDINPETYPTWARIELQFPARGDMPPVKLFWYEGSRKEGRVLPPEELTHGHRVSDSGSLLVGDKGVLFSPNDYGASFTLLPEKEFKDYKGPAETLPRNGKGDEGMKAEWVNAIRGGKPAMSNFNYAARLTEAVLLGNVAMRAGKETVIKRHGKDVHVRKLEWDAEQVRATNAPEAEQFIKPQYRKGYTLEG